MRNLLIPVETLDIVHSGRCVAQAEGLVDVVEIGHEKL